MEKITYETFAKFCSNWRANSKKISDAYKIDIDLIHFSDLFFANEEILLKIIFGETKTDMLIDWLAQNWNGEYKIDGEKFKINNDDDMWRFLNE